MYGSFIKQFFYGFLGIDADVGFKNVTIRPQYINGLEFVEGSIKTSEGRTLFIRHEFADGKIKTVARSKE